MVVEQARERVARLIGAGAGEVVLTGGGTEANNLALYGAAHAAPAGARRVVASAFEHPSILAGLDDLAGRGYEVIRVRPGRAGVVEPREVLAAAGAGRTALVTLMLANNEVGTVQPVSEIGAALRGRGVLLHCDAAQAAGKMPIDVGGLGVDLMTLAGHKFGAPQGVGALYVRRGVRLVPHLRGGGQELNRRPGTENVAAIAGFGAAAESAAAGLEVEAARMAALRDRLESEALRRALASAVNGAGAERLPNTTSLAFDGPTGEALVMALDLEGIAVSAGSACSAGTLRRSPSLDAMGLSREAAASIRVSLGPGTEASEIDRLLAVLEAILPRFRTPALAGRAERRA